MIKYCGFRIFDFGSIYFYKQILLLKSEIPNPKLIIAPTQRIAPAK